MSFQLAKDISFVLMEILNQAGHRLFSGKGNLKSCNHYWFTTNIAKMSSRTDFAYEIPKNCVVNFF